MDPSFHISLTWGIIISLILAAVILTPFLIRDIGKGQRQSRPGTPSGADETRPGDVSNPAPGRPDAQADPYSPRAHRDQPSPIGRTLERHS